MDIVKIQSLIAQGRIIDLSSTDPSSVYLQLGVYQAPNSRLSSGDAISLKHIKNTISCQ